mmetsp:Transcript_47348/g.94437  ORF Transcript_47348/g.94437 Transcript_47348/m.94437 type:complete len:168 (-) Transcript_47348:26-529(-)
MPGEAQRADDIERIERLSVRLPFPRGVVYGRGSLRCVPFGSMVRGKSPLSKPSCKEGHNAPLLQPPGWDEYRAVLGASAEPPLAASLSLDQLGVHGQGPGAKGKGLGGKPSTSTDDAPAVEYAAVVRALEQVSGVAVVYLPSRLKIERIPKDVLSRLEQFCTSKLSK